MYVSLFAFVFFLCFPFFLYVTLFSAFPCIYFLKVRF